MSLSGLYPRLGFGRNWSDSMSSSKPRVLILTHRIPFPPNRGDRIRAYHLVEFLSHRADVYLGSVSDEPWESSQRDALEKLCRSVFFARVESPWRWLRASAGFALGKSVTQGAFYSPQLADQVRLWSCEFQFDAAIMYCSSMGPNAASEIKGCKCHSDHCGSTRAQWPVAPE